MTNNKNYVHMCANLEGKTNLKSLLHIKYFNVTRRNRNYIKKLKITKCKIKTKKIKCKY